MAHKVQRLLVYVLSGFFLFVLLYPSDESEANPRRRSCNPSLGKERALEYLHSNKRLAELARVEYRQKNIDATMVQDDGEILTDIDDLSLDAEGRALKELEAMDSPQDIGDINAFEDLWLSYMDEIEEQEEYTAGGISKSGLLESVVSWFGTRYRFGGTTSRGIDCSAFMQKIYRDAAGVELPRTARWQHQHGLHVNEKDDLRFGDMVFFHTRRRVRVSHVGIYLGDNLFAHASSRYGVTISSLESNYYSKRFIGGRRLTVEDVMALSPEPPTEQPDALPVNKAMHGVDTLTTQQ